MLVVLELKGYQKGEPCLEVIPGYIECKRPTKSTSHIVFFINEHRCVGSLLGLQFCSIDLFTCPCARFDQYCTAVELGDRDVDFPQKLAYC